MTGLSRSRLYELIKSGEIEVVKVGTSTLVLVESLAAAIDRRRTTGPSPTTE
jgi:excisionase family DNA binding protein